MKYKVNTKAQLNLAENKFYKKLKKSFTEIKEWEVGNINLQDAKEAIKEIEAELKNST